MLSTILIIIGATIVWYGWYYIVAFIYAFVNLDTSPQLINNSEYVRAIPNQYIKLFIFLLPIILLAAYRIYLVVFKNINLIDFIKKDLLFIVLPLIIIILLRLIQVGPEVFKIN